ncbi:MAG: protein kinase [Myxococcales bacterium]|nr:protein kinase [Myxococcales bacterium]
MAAKTSRQLEKYTLVEEVGQGGMAVVYRGHDTSLDREVAVKILHPHLADQEESKRRFQREAQAVAKLRHDNILEIYDYSGLESDESYIVTEFIHGHTLKAFLTRHPISHPEIAAMIIAEVTGALGHAHGVGIIHRDIKPENIMIRADGRVKLTDFGIAQIVDMQQLTVTGQLLGSPAYMAPELVEGGAIDFRADIFSVGTLLYQLATAELPFKGKNPHEVLKRIADGNFVAPEAVNPLVGDKLGKIIRRALARNPAERYRSVEELHGALMDFLGDVDIEEPRAELRRYFADPAEYSRELQERVVRALTQRGKSALEQGRSAAALAYFDRVLCADPRNAEVLALLDQIARRRRMGRVMVVLAMVLLLGGGAYGVGQYWPLGGGGSARGSGSATAVAIGGSGSGSARAVVAGVGSSSGASGAASATAAGTGAVAAGTAAGTGSAAAGTSSGTAVASKMPGVKLASATVNGSVRRPKRHATRANKLLKARVGAGTGSARPAVVKARRVEIIPTPKAVTIFVDGKKLGAYGPDLRFLTLPAGDVELKFRNAACCFDKRISIGADKRPGVLRVRLPWKPGRLRVLVEPKRAKAEVILGSIVGRPGHALEVQIPAKEAYGRTTVELKVSAPGFATKTKRVQVRANAMTTTTVTLSPSK